MQIFCDWYHGWLDIASTICNARAGLSVDIFCWGSGAPTIWISKGPKQNLKGPSIEIHYQFSNLGGPLGPQTKFHKGPIGFSGARGPYLRAPECPVESPLFTTVQLQHQR